jgi:hypothetical protein
MVRILIFSFLSLFLASSADSQILKINRIDLAVDTSHVFSGDINLNLNINNQSATPEENLIFTGIEFRNNLTYLSEKHAYLLINNLNYFTITGGPLVSTGHAHGRVNLLRRKILSYELFTQVQYDEGRRMPLRYLFGGGIRLKILKGEKGNMYGGIGIMNEFEQWEPFKSERHIKKQIWKSTSYLSGKILVSKNFTIDIISYYQSGWDDESNVFRHRISGDLILNARITGRLAFTTNFALQYESDPIININPVVFSLTNGLKLNF